MTDWLRDLRYAFRMLAVQPGWTLAAVACLAIATGANTAAYSVVNAVLLRPLPFPEPAQLVMVALKAPEGSDTRPFALREYLDLAPQAASFTSLAAYTFMPVTPDLRVLAYAPVAPSSPRSSSASHRRIVRREPT